MESDARLEDLLRELAPQVLGAVLRRYGDFDAAEDAVQEALLAAATTWPAQGVPENPRGWLITAAVRRLVDAYRGERARQRREEQVATQDVPPGEVVSSDDSLLLFFLCCHPSLSAPSAIALTLRAVGGLTTAEIARAFLVPEATMAQRISRAKQRIADSEVPLRPTDSGEWHRRLRSVLHVLYLMFNEGYASSGGSQLYRVNLSDEAIRLTRQVHGLLPDDPELTGLLALMLLTDARRHARIGKSGQLIPLAEQDRSRWNRRSIAEGLGLVADALRRGAVGEYQLQASIAGLHAQAPTYADTDWPQIVTLYRLLERMTGNPVVTLNRAIATAMVQGPQAGLTLLESLDEPLRGSHRLDAARGHLLEMAGDIDGARSAYRRAAERTASIPERDYLTRQSARLRFPEAPVAAASEQAESIGRGRSLTEQTDRERT